MLRTLGKKEAAATLLVDVLKGFLPTFAAGLAVSDLAAILCATAALLGHMWPVCFRFQGGKGVATGFGAALAIDWKVGLLALLFAVLGVVIAALYVLMPYQRVFTGAPGKGKEDLADLGARERCVMTPLVVAMLVLGIWSAPLVSALTPVASDLGLPTTQVGATAEGSAQ